MIKKISAILLALVLCLSVVVVPASAAVELGDAQVAFALEWDKEYYSKGDTATLSIYMDAADDIELYTGSILIGLNSSVFNGTDNPIADVKANATSADWFDAFYKHPSTQLSYLTNAKQVGYVTDDSTEEEKATFDTYLKYTAAKRTDGSHENTSATKNGFYGSDFVADEPILTIQLVVSSDVADATAVKAAIMSGSLTTTSGTAQTHWKYYANPGVSSATNLSSSVFDISTATTTSTIGEEPAEIIPLQLSHWKNQIRFDTYKDGTYSGTFDGRILMSIDNFDEVFGDVAGAEASVIDAGFIFAKSTSGAGMNVETAQAQVRGESTAYTQVKKAFVSTAFSEKSYVMSCMIENVADADKAGTYLSAMAYVIYTDANGDTAYAYSPVVTSTFESLYNTNFSKAFPA